MLTSVFDETKMTLSAQIANLGIQSFQQTLESIHKLKNLYTPTYLRPFSMKLKCFNVGSADATLFQRRIGSAEHIARRSAEHIGIYYCLPLMNLPERASVEMGVVTVRSQNRFAVFQPDRCECPLDGLFDARVVIPVVSL